MSDDAEQPVDMAFIGRSLRRLLVEVATLHDDVNVLAAIVRRIDNNQDRQLEELRAMHS